MLLASLQCPHIHRNTNTVDRFVFLTLYWYLSCYRGEYLFTAKSGQECSQAVTVTVLNKYLCPPALLLVKYCLHYSQWNQWLERRKYQISRYFQVSLKCILLFYSLLINLNLLRRQILCHWNMNNWSNWINKYLHGAAIEWNELHYWQKTRLVSVTTVSILTAK